MVFYGTGKRQLPRRLVNIFSLIFLLFFLSPLAAQDGDGSEETEEENEEPRITVEISPDRIIVGQRFDLTIYADFDSYRSVQIKEPELPDGITLASGPYKSAQTIRIGELSEARYIKKTRVYYKFKVSRPGIYTMGGFSLTDGETSLVSEPVVFPALAFDERNFKYPVFAQWNEIPQEIMIGETIPLILTMENLEALAFPDIVDMAAPAGGMFERVNSIGEIEVAAIGEDEVFIAPIDSWLYTPTSTGIVKIPGASVQIGNIKRTSPALNITVLDSPAEIESSGAVGSFALSTEMENLPFAKGRVSTLRVRVEGDGNLNYLKMPNPQFIGLSLVEKEEIIGFVPSESGYSGYREDVYRLSPGDEREINISFEPWSWFDRSSGQIEREALTGYTFENEMKPEDPRTFSRREEFSLHNSAVISDARNPIYNVPMYYLLLLPGLVSVAAALIRKKYDRKLMAFALISILFLSPLAGLVTDFESDLIEAERLFSQNEQEGALEIYNRLSKENVQNPALFYNMALINYDLERKGEAVYNLRRALNLKPGNNVYRSALKMMEENFDLEHQVRAATGLSPDLFFLFFIILFNGGALVASFNIRKRKMELSILIIMIFFLSILSLGVVFYSHLVSKADTAVVIAPGGELKKVPGEQGGSWLTLQEGTAVTVLSRSDNSVLIRTGYGLEGWLDEPSLFFLQEGL